MALSFSACGKTDTSDSTSKTETSKEGGSDIVFTVGDVEITKSEFEAYLSSYTQAGYDIETAKEYAKTDITNNAALIAVVNKQGGFTDEDDKEVESKKKDIVEYQGGEDGYKKFLSSLGVDDNFITRELLAQVAQEKLFGDEISDENVKEYYQNNYWRAKHILLKTQDDDGNAYDDAKKAEIKAKAEKLLAQAQAGADFDELIKENSEDPGSQTNPDGYYFTKSEMVTEFEDCVKSLGMNEFGMCESTYGYHIIQRLPLEDESKFEDVKTSIKQMLIHTMTDEKLPELMKENGIEVVTDDEVYNSITE